jgi:hypothetical protein
MQLHHIPWIPRRSIQISERLRWFAQVHISNDASAIRCRQGCGQKDAACRLKAQNRVLAPRQCSTVHKHPDSNIRQQEVVSR